MRTITSSICFVVVAIVISMFVVESLSYDLCASYKKYGFPTKDNCLNAINANSLRKFPIVSPIKNVISNAVSGIADKVTSVVADIVLKKAAGHSMFSRVSLALSPKKKFLLSAMNHEPGFDLTKEEIAKFKLWDKGVIPYFIDEYSFDKVLRDRIRSNLDLVNAATGVQFMEIPRPPDDENTKYVIFINRRGVLRCVDHTTNDFTHQGIQKLVLGYDCIDLRAGMAGLILTVLGVPPQHNAPNRNHYIEVIKKNILPDKLSFFNILSNSDWLFHDLEYDFESATHYPYHKYSAIGGSTIRPKWHVSEPIPVGESKTLSSTDVLKVKMLYNYISRSSTDSKHKACSNMFQQGGGFSKYRPRKNNVIPREKPPKYLGTDPFAALSQNDEGENSEEDANGDADSDFQKLKENNVKVNETEKLKLEVQNDNHSEYSGNDNTVDSTNEDARAEAIKRETLKNMIQNTSDITDDK